MEFGRFLKELRIRRGLSMRELSRRAGISQAYISQMEKGDRGNPKPEVIVKLAPHLNISYPELMNVAGYLVKDNEFTEEEINFLESLDEGTPLIELMKLKPTIDQREITLTELDIAINVIRGLRQTKEKEGT